MMHFGIISLMPEMFQALNYGITSRAIEQKLVQIDTWNPRGWGLRPYRQIDDKAYGGGPGMVMMYEPLDAAIREAKSTLPADCKTVYLSPQGRIIVQKDLSQVAEKKQSILFIAGRYEGIDERVIKRHVDEEWSLGDFVMSGGEIAALAFIDGIVRLLPGALGHEESAKQDSFMDGLLDCPHYTRPALVDGEAVPEVLMGGNHRDILRWRRKQALGNTWLKRPDLLEKLELSAEDKKLLQEFVKNQNE